MRLHTLTLSAFGPFGGTHRVDFDKLTAAGLYLLHGATGAGKTSILDAVCFALYGSVPGARQQPSGLLRSHHADPHTLTRVVLDMTVAERRLEITRSPEQPRPKKSGTGMTRERAHSALREWDAAGGRWKGLSRSHQEIGEEVVGLLGMSRDQFCQVALLPQGDFARFLRAGAEDRAKLLGRLFDTGRFACAEEELARMRRDKQDAVRDADEALLGLAHRIRQAAGTDIVPIPDQRGAADTADTVDHGHSQSTEALLEQAALARCEARERYESTQLAGRDAEARHDEAEAAWEDARTLDRLQREYNQAQRRSSELAARSDEWRAAEDSLRRARSAESVMPVIALWDSAATQYGDATAAEKDRRSVLPDDWARADAEQLTEGERELRRELGTLAAARRTEHRSENITKELAQLERDSHVDEELAREAAEWLADWETVHSAHRGRVREAQEAATRAEHLAGQLTPVRRQLEAARHRDRLDQERAAAEQALYTVREHASTAWEHWLDLKDRRLRGVAAELAAALLPRTPCSVCGATEHPDPAQPDAEHVDQHAEDAALEAHRAANTAREEAESRVRSLEEQQTVAHAEAGDHSVGELADAARQLESACREARTLAADAHPASEELYRAEQEHARRLAGWQEAEQRVASRASRREALQQEQAELAEELRRVCGESEHIAERAAAVENHAAALAEAAEAARATVSAAARLQEADAQLEEALRATHFRSVEQVRTANLDSEEQRALQESLEAWQAEEKAVSDTLADSALVSAARRAPAEPARAREALEEAARRLREGTAAQDAARTRCHELDQLSAEAEAVVRRTAPTRLAYERVAALASLAAGTSAANVRRMRLETYVLAARLEQVAAAASVRLAHMSAGRYTLVHSDERASGGARSGLGLHVVDSWTGVERDTATLSGGETFFASLALALGLADVVTDEAGGARLDTLFIDEGFGSLDEQTLDEVLDVLDGLRERDRSVGIVSHVPDLRRRIPTQLEVVKARGGSSLRMRTAPIGD